MDGQEPADRPSFFRKPTSPGATPPQRPAPPAPPPPVDVAPPSGFGAEPPPLSSVRHPTFHGNGGTLFGIHVVNVLLTLVTFGVYYFWAKTRIRGYLSGQTEIEGDRFAYHGTARELLLGTIKAVLVFGVPILFLNMIRDVLDVPPFQWSMCTSGTRCWATDAKTGTPCTLWTDAVQTADTLPTAEKNGASSAR